LLGFREAWDLEKKGRVKNHANSLGESQMEQNMVIKIDRLSATASAAGSVMLWSDRNG
jgi:hypothetical protein